MELTGNSANRWEQVSNKIGDIAFETDKQREQLEKLITELVDLAGHIRSNQEILTKLSGIVYKEVFREESKMLNDDSDESSPIQAPVAQVQNTDPKQDKILEESSSQQTKTTNHPKKMSKKSEQPAVPKTDASEEKQLLLLKDEQSHE